MKQITIFLTLLLLGFCAVNAQTTNVSQENDIFFVSDTQQPLVIEKLLLRKSHHNKKATANILAALLEEKPRNIYMLGDVVGLGYANRKWKKVDIFLDSCRKQGTTVCGILGNHEVMARCKKGERNFQKRFPMNVKTGYVSITDSVAVVLLNSNFKKLSAEEKLQQQEWYRSTMTALDTTTAVKAVIVCCHHAPYTNSKVAKCSNKVQEYFVKDYISSKKAQLFITGHAHAFEHFKMNGKDFLVIGGGGGLHQRLKDAGHAPEDLANEYKPMFHYLSVKREGDRLFVMSHYLKDDFSGINAGYTFNTGTMVKPESTLAKGAD
ncbi:MAG: metallophosphoesterase [Ferruginibacter sp.]